LVLLSLSRFFGLGYTFREVYIGIFFDIYLENIATRVYIYYFLGVTSLLLYSQSLAITGVDMVTP